MCLGPPTSQEGAVLQPPHKLLVFWAKGTGFQHQGVVLPSWGGTRLPAAEPLKAANGAALLLESPQSEQAHSCPSYLLSRLVLSVSVSVTKRAMHVAPVTRLRGGHRGRHLCVLLYLSAVKR